MDFEAKSFGRGINWLRGPSSTSLEQPDSRSPLESLAEH